MIRSSTIFPMEKSIKSRVDVLSMNLNPPCFIPISMIESTVFENSLDFLSFFLLIFSQAWRITLLNSAHLSGITKVSLNKIGKTDLETKQNVNVYDLRETFLVSNSKNPFKNVKPLGGFLMFWSRIKNLIFFHNI